MNCKQAAKIVRDKKGFELPLEWMKKMEEDPELAIILWNILTEMLLWPEDRDTASLFSFCTNMSSFNPDGDDASDLLIDMIDRTGLYEIGDEILDDPQLSHVLTLHQAGNFSVENENDLLEQLESEDRVKCTKIYTLKSTWFPIYWVTKTDDAKNFAAADEANARLGLAHPRFYPYSSRRTYLVEMRYPVGFSVQLKRPTAFGAGLAIYFRVQIDLSARSGQTQDLKKLKRDLPEAVHDSCESTTDFELFPLGYIMEELEIELSRLLDNAKRDFDDACGRNGQKLTHPTFGN